MRDVFVEGAGGASLNSLKSISKKGLGVGSKLMWGSITFALCGRIESFQLSGYFSVQPALVVLVWNQRHAIYI